MELMVKKQTPHSLVYAVALIWFALKYYKKFAGGQITKHFYLLRHAARIILRIYEW
jgi:hypothetical protein